MNKRRPPPDAFAEVELLDQEILKADISFHRADAWQPVWGNVFTASKFYEFCFRRMVVPRLSNGFGNPKYL